MKIRIDGVEIPVLDENKNIVEVAEESGIAIVAPCFRSKRKGGCCKACLIEVNGEKKYACATKPIDGMNIVYNTLKLQRERDVAIKKYVENVNQKKDSFCCSSGATELNGDSCCEATGCSCN